MNRRLENVEEERNLSDTELINESDPSPVKKVVTKSKGQGRTISRGGSKVDIDLTSEGEEGGNSTKKGKEVALSSSLSSLGSAFASATKEKEEKGSFVPMAQEFLDLIKLLPPPTTSNTGASLNIRREMKAMINLQKEEGPIGCGFYFDPFVLFLFRSFFFRQEGCGVNED